MPDSLACGLAQDVPRPYCRLSAARFGDKRQRGLVILIVLRPAVRASPSKQLALTLGSRLPAFVPSDGTRRLVIQVVPLRNEIVG